MAAEALLLAASPATNNSALSGLARRWLITAVSEGEARGRTEGCRNRSCAAATMDTLTRPTHLNARDNCRYDPA